MTALDADEVYWITLACLLETALQDEVGREKAAEIHAACVARAKAKAGLAE